MNPRTITCMLIVLSALRLNSFAQTPTVADLNALRAQVEEMRTNYEKRIESLEMQLQALQAQTPAAPKPEEPAPAAQAPAQAPAQTPTAEIPAGAQGAAGQAGALPVYGGTAGSKVFNPDIAVIGDFIGAFGSKIGSHSSSVGRDRVTKAAGYVDCVSADLPPRCAEQLCAEGTRSGERQ